MLMGIRLPVFFKAEKTEEFLASIYGSKQPLQRRGGEGQKRNAINHFLSLN
jgi:hypothetical protein